MSRQSHRTSGMLSSSPGGVRRTLRLKGGSRQMRADHRRRAIHVAVKCCMFVEKRMAEGLPIAQLGEERLVRRRETWEQYFSYGYRNDHFNHFKYCFCLCCRTESCPPATAVSPAIDHCFDSARRRSAVAVAFSLRDLNPLSSSGLVSRPLCRSTVGHARRKSRSAALLSSHANLTCTCCHLVFHSRRYCVVFL